MSTFPQRSILYPTTKRTMFPYRPLIVAMLLPTLCGCNPPAASNSPAVSEVTVYCALDREFSELVLMDDEEKTGIHVLAKYDVESTKTVGLVNAIIQESARPRCDLFWNNEILHTLRLKKLGLLEPFEASYAKVLPPSFVDPEKQWYGFAARARVLLVNSKIVRSSEMPASIDDLLDPNWKGKIGMAKPLFGTTATHAAVLFAERGPEQAKRFFTEFRENGGKFLSGNKQVAKAVAAGELAFGLTDTDDAIAEVDSSMPVKIVFPDQAAGQSGTLLIPNTICLIRGAPHGIAARKLADNILSKETETFLSETASAQIPLLSHTAVRSRVLPKDTSIRWMEVDFEKAAEQWDDAAEFLTEFIAP